MWEDQEITLRAFHPSLRSVSTTQAQSRLPTLEKPQHIRNCMITIRSAHQTSRLSLSPLSLTALHQPHVKGEATIQYIASGIDSRGTNGLSCHVV